MTTKVKSVTERSKGAARRIYKNVENRILVAQGRKAVQAKIETARKVTRTAVKAGIITGSLAALGFAVVALRNGRRERS